MWWRSLAMKTAMIITNKKKTQLLLGPLVTTNTMMRITNRKEKTMTMIISKEVFTMALATQQLWKYNIMLWTPIITMIMTINLGIHLYLKSKTLKEKECVWMGSSTLNQTKLLPQHYRIGTMMRLCFFFVWGHCS